MKCNNNNYVLETLKNNGFGFDCASKKEIECSIKTLKMDPDKIIYANPVKSESDIFYAKNLGVKLFTLDSNEELRKLNNSDFLLRFAVNDDNSKCKLNSKFGMNYNDTLKFISDNSNIDGFKGFAFHVGSNCMSYESYFNALNLSTEYLKLLKKDCIIDIGGGFNKTIGYLDLLKVSLKIKEMSYFIKNIKFIAEPGRFLVEDIMDLYVRVIGVSGNKVTINSSVYGDFNPVAFDYKVCTFDIIRDDKLIVNDEGHEAHEALELYNIYGNTCDSLDIIRRNVKCPKIYENDILKFHNMGAYTIVSRSEFNGIECAKILIV